MLHGELCMVCHGPAAFVLGAIVFLCAYCTKIAALHILARGR